MCCTINVYSVLCSMFTKWEELQQCRSIVYWMYREQAGLYTGKWAPMKWYKSVHYLALTHTHTTKLAQLWRSAHRVVYRLIKSDKKRCCKAWVCFKWVNEHQKSFKNLLILYLLKKRTCLVQHEKELWELYTYHSLYSSRFLNSHDLDHLEHIHHSLYTCTTPHLQV